MTAACARLCTEFFTPSLCSTQDYVYTQMNALIAPRAHLSLAGNQDALTPVAGLEKIDRGLQEVYASAGHPEHWKLLRYDGEHLETPVMREEIRKWLVAHL